MANEKNILIRFTADTGGLDESTQKMDELRAKNTQAWDEYDKAVEAKKKAVADGSVKEQQAIKEYNDAIRKSVSEIDKSEKQIKKMAGDGVKDIDRLGNAFKELPKKIPEKQVEKSFRTIKREIENQIKSMEMLGKTGTDEYQKLIKEAGRLADIEGDVQRQIKGIASDTAKFDLIMEGTQGIAAGFQVAQGAAALFGVEQEKLMPMMIKLQALMAVTTGLQQLQNTIQKESYVMRAVSNLQLNAAARAEAAHARAIAIKTGAENGSVVALGKATIAQKTFNLVAKANPYVLLATALVSVVGALALFTRATNESSKAQKISNDLGKEAAQGYSEQQTELELMRAKISLATTSLNEKQKILKVVNDKYLDSKHQLKSINELEDWLVKATPAVIEAYAARATAELARAKVAETNIAIIEEQKKSDEEYLKWYDKADVWVYGLFGKGEQKRKSVADAARSENIANLEQDKEIYKNAVIEFESIWNDMSESLGLKTEDAVKNIVEKTGEATKKIATREIEDVKNKVLLTKDYSKKEVYIHQEKKDEILKLTQDRIEREMEMERQKEEYKRELIMSSIDYAGRIGGELFGLHQDRLQQEMSDLEHYYTTDVEEARKNKDKKLITEQELAKKKLEIKRKQAQADKMEGIFNVGISTAQSIMASAKMGFPAAIPFIAMAAALGAVQLAAVASKPLPKYWKGRKGGKGEFAMVGEHGPEMMWVPSGASVVPAHVSSDVIRNGKSDLLKNWNIPSIYNIDIPRVSKETIHEIRETQKQAAIDYDLLGRSVAKHIIIPKAVEKNVNIKVDKDGVHVSDADGSRTFKNIKYTGEWN